MVSWLTNGHLVPRVAEDVVQLLGVLVGSTRDEIEVALRDEVRLKTRQKMTSIYVKWAHNLTMYHVMLGDLPLLPRPVNICVQHNMLSHVPTRKTADITPMAGMIPCSRMSLDCKASNERDRVRKILEANCLVI